MADSSVEILIKCIDEVSSEVKNISKTLEGMQKDVNSNNKKLQDSFTSVSNNVLAFGQAAQRVDSIMSSYTNMQLRLENASERVTGAQDRLATSQYELNKVMKSGTATAEDMAEAQRKVESATRALTISQNNQARMQNMVIGTYISMGVQMTQLIAMYPQLMASVEGLGVTFAGLIAKMNPVGLALTAVAATLAVGSFAIEKHQESINKLTVEQQNQILSLDQLIKKKEELAIEEERLTKIASGQSEMSKLLVWSYDEQTGSIRILTQQTVSLMDLADLKAEKDNVDIKLIKAKTEANELLGLSQLQLLGLGASPLAEQIKLSLKKESNKEQQQSIRYWEDEITLRDGINTKEDEIIKLTREHNAFEEDMIKSLKEQGFAQSVIDSLILDGNKAFAQQLVLVDKLKQSMREYLSSAGGGDKYDSWGGNMQWLDPETGKWLNYSETTPAKDVMIGGEVVHVPRKPKDFIITKNGDFIEPDKNDTIMGFKGAIPTQGGQQEVVVKNYIYLDGQQIAYSVGRSVAEGLSVR